MQLLHCLIHNDAVQEKHPKKQISWGFGHFIPKVTSLSYIFCLTIIHYNVNLCIH